MDRPPGYNQIPPPYESQYGDPDDVDDEVPNYAAASQVSVASSQRRLLQGMDDYASRPPPTPTRGYQPAAYQGSRSRSRSRSRTPSPQPARIPAISQAPHYAAQAPPSLPSLPFNTSTSSLGYQGYGGGGIQSSPTRYAPEYAPGPAAYSRGSSRVDTDERPWTPEAGSRVSEGRWAEGASDWRRGGGYDRPASSHSMLSGSALSAVSSRRPLPPAPVGGRSSMMSGQTVAEEEYYDTESESGDEVGSEFGDEEEGRSIDIDSALERPKSTGVKSIDSDATALGADDETPEKIPEVVRTKGENFGPAPERLQARRGLNRQALLTRKQVKLINGELILDCPIPTILNTFLPRRDAREFTHMRYTAVTCDPDHFVERGYLLRQNMDDTRRETELFICITMFNEDENCFTRTMHGVMRNIAHFCARSKSRVWGKDGWQKIVVCITADGRKKVHPRVLDALAAMGVFQEGIAKNVVNGREVTAHVYEYTTQVSLDSDMKFKGAEKGIVPVQIIFCMKERNQKKLNSHRWFFNAFGQALHPNVCILLDVGTRPGLNSLYHLWKAFDRDSDVGGACGEIKAMKGKGWLGLLNPLVASQNFEYKMSNILDKPLESVFGYITVLPGALSAYRYHALQNDEHGNGPLAQYFKGEDLKGKDADVFTANMYLAEDRILCWELVAKRSERWVLKYVRSATGETDVPDAVPEFISQRRRWLNGAFFAAIYSLVHFRQVWNTDHTIVRKILLHAEFVYQAMSLLFTFFSLANFYLSFYFIAGSLSDERLDPFGGGWGMRFFVFLRFLCVLLICTQFILCMGNRPQGAARSFKASMIAYGFIMAYTTFCGLYIVFASFSGTIKGMEVDISFGNNIFTNLIVSTGSTIGVYILMSILYLDPWHMITSAGQYAMMLPSYLCTLQIYAFCNTHDVSWGTKGADETFKDLGSAVKTKGDTVELEMPSEQLDIDSGYDEALRNLRDRLEVEKPQMTEEQRNEDYYRAFRTYVVVVWMISNAVLAMIITEVYDINDVKGNTYLKFILWSVAALAVYRMFGSMAYLVLQGLHTFVEGKVKLDPDRIKSRFQPAWKRRIGASRKANSSVAV